MLKQPGGNALLVGVGGSGRQSITKLATSMAGMTLFQPEISKNYGINEWRDDLKVILVIPSKKYPSEATRIIGVSLIRICLSPSQLLLKKAGMMGQKMVFLLTDAQIKDEAFLEDVDSLLNTGEVPNIFAVDEKQEIMEVIYKNNK